MSSIAKKLAEEILRRGEKIIIIDGMSSAGKTTLAAELSEILDCDVIHIDDFFLPKARQTSFIAGNIDSQRFKLQIINHLGDELYYERYDCKSGTYSNAVKIRGGRVIIEGAYACHESLGLKGGLRIFLEIDREEQRRRILSRENEPSRFFDIWIPKEEEYFSSCRIKHNCDIKLYKNEWK